MYIALTSHFSSCLLAGVTEHCIHLSVKELIVLLCAPQKYVGDSRAQVCSPA